MKVLPLCLFSLSSLTLVACGGGSSTTPEVSPQPPVSTPTPAPAPVMPKGLWLGTVASGGQEIQAAGIIAPDGKARFILENGEQDRVQLTLDGNKFTGDGASFDTNGVYWGVFSTTGEFTDSSITGTVSTNGQQTGAISFTLSSESNLPASLAEIAGTYADENNETNITIDSAGVVTGSDVYNCKFNGNVSVPDASVNIYSLNISVSDCAEVNGEYQGLGTYAKPFADSTSKVFMFQGDNGTYALTSFLIKQ